jgi:hypothetical protein
MKILVNGRTLALEEREGSSLGEILAGVDDLIEKSGSVIVSLKVDGEEIDAARYASISSKPISSIDEIEITAESSSVVRIRAIETLLDLAASIKASASDESPETERDWRSLRTWTVDLCEAFAGLFASDELSFVTLLSDLLVKAGDDPDRASRIEISAQAERIYSIFSERLAELKNPSGEMRAAASLFDQKSGDLAELPVLMQTGRESEAMKSVLYFIEIFNKVIRILPELRRSGIDTASIKIDDKYLPEFYDSFNEVLRELVDGLEHHDAVLIGDLAEYEVLPRMKSFFSVMREVLPA